MSVTKKPELTKWFDGSVKPVRDGVYERQDNRLAFGNLVYSKYKWSVWHVYHYNAEQAAAENAISNCQDSKWRGLAQNPEVQP